MSLKIKGLKSRLIEAEGALADAKERLRNANRAYEETKRQKESIVHQIAALLESKLVITEHALLRLCERKFEMPIDKMEVSLREKLEPLSKKMGDGNYPIGDGLFAVIKGNTVITIKQSARITKPH